MGLGSPANARAATLRTLGVGVSYMGILGIPLWFYGELVAGLFTEDQAVIAGAAAIFKVMALYQVFDAVSMILRSALSGAGDTRIPALILPLLAVLVLFPSSWLLAFWLQMGLLGAYLGVMLFMVLLAAAMTLRFTKGPWARINVRTA